MEDRYKLCQVKAYFKISDDDKHPLYEDLFMEKGTRLKRGKSWMARAEDTISLVCPLSEVEHEEEWIGIPKDMQKYFNVVITLDRSCREQNPLMVDQKVKALIDEHSRPGDIIIYTDGSVVRGERSAWAFTSQRNGRTLHEDSGAFPTTTSSMTMEVMAASRALEWVKELNVDVRHICIVTDSMSMLRKIEAGSTRKQWISSISESSLQKITWIFTPGHAGVKGNERADHLAGIAEMEEGKSMDRADIITAIKEKFKKDEDCQSETMCRLQELGIKRGIATKEHLSGKSRRFVNQHRTGTVSRGTLVGLLQRRAEHVWVCPECNDVCS